MKGIIQATRGRPSKVTKAAQTPRGGRPVRRIGADALPNQDPDLENEDIEIDDNLEQAAQQHEQQQEEQQQQPEHHEQHFDPEAAAAAAAAAAAHQHHQHQQQQLDLTAASILNSVQNPNEQHHDLGEPPLEGEAHERTTEAFAQQSGYQNVIVESTLAKRLAREPGMRLATQRRPEQVLNLQRRSNVEALFAHIAGDMAPVPCKNCHKGHGPWNTCVTVDGQMCGSCANCWFNASGARCSFHETRNPQAHPNHLPGVPNEQLGFQMQAAPPQALAPFNFASIPATADPLVRYTIEQAMAQVRGADHKARRMLMVEATARQLAFQIMQYEDAVEDEQNQQQGPPQAVMNEQDAP